MKFGGLTKNLLCFTDSIKIWLTNGILVILSLEPQNYLIQQLIWTD